MFGTSLKQSTSPSLVNKIKFNIMLVCIYKLFNIIVILYFNLSTTGGRVVSSHPTLAGAGNYLPTSRFPLLLGKK